MSNATTHHQETELPYEARPYQERHGNYRPCDPEEADFYLVIRRHDNHAVSGALPWSKAVKLTTRMNDNEEEAA